MPNPIAYTNYIFACHITGVYDVNRNETLAADDISLCLPWIRSVEKAGLKAVLFHNNFSAATVNAYSCANLQFQQINYDVTFKPNVYRYKAYCDYLQQHVINIQNLFITDVADVVLLNNPFTQPLFIDNVNCLFCGDEPVNLNNEWMQQHSAFLRPQIAGYAHFEQTFANNPLLNCGIVGGSIKVMQLFLQQLWHLHQTYNKNNTTVYTGDMGAFNYLVRTKYNHQLKHGAPINTVFKAYDTFNTTYWFRHK